MSERTSQSTGAAPKNGRGGHEAPPIRRAQEDVGQGAAQAARSTEAVTDKMTEAGQEAARASQEIFRTNVETAKDAMRAGMEASTRTLETMTTNLAQSFGVGVADGPSAEQAVQNIRAVSQASTALARAAQDACLAWLELAGQTARTNLEALSQFRACRTPQDVITVQSHLARETIQRLIDGGDRIARSTTVAVEQANHAMRGDAGQTPGR